MANLVTKIAKWFMRVFVLGFTLFFSYATFVAWRDNILSGKVVATSLLVIGVLLTVAVFLPGGPFLLSEVYWGRRIKREEIHWIEHKPNEYYIVYSKDKEDFLDRLMMGDNDTLAQARRLLWKGSVDYFAATPRATLMLRSQPCVQPLDGSFDKQMQS